MTVHTVQPALPGMPVRFIVSAVWEAGERRCTIRATSDAPSDELSSMFVGQDTDGYFTIDELGDAMCIMLLDTVQRWKLQALGE